MFARQIMLAAVSAATLSAGAASAATSKFIDFTDRPTWEGSGLGATTSVGYGSLTVSLSTNPVNNLNFNDNYDGSPALPALEGFAGDSDGAGVLGDDEVTGINDAVTPPLESITVSFNKTVSVSQMQFLDLFRAPSFATTGNTEKVRYYWTLGGVQSATVVFDALVLSNVAGGAGFGETATNFKADSITFFTFNSSLVQHTDEDGTADFTLASLTVTPVPLPAAAWMLIAGVAGIAALGRKKVA